MQLDTFNNTSFDRGRPAWMEGLWLLVQWLLVHSWIPGSAHRLALLRLFGATIGSGVVIKPGLKVKFPWKLTVGNHSWLGEDLWIDNLEAVRIGNHCCISQGVYFCTGSHNWYRSDFALIVKPIVIADHVWISAKSVIGPGVTVEENCVITLASVVTGRLPERMICSGNPCKPVKERKTEGC